MLGDLADDNWANNARYGSDCIGDAENNAGIRTSKVIDVY